MNQNEKQGQASFCSVVCQLNECLIDPNVRVIFHPSSPWCAETRYRSSGLLILDCAREITTLMVPPRSRVSPPGEWPESLSHCVRPTRKVRDQALREHRKPIRLTSPFLWNFSLPLWSFSPSFISSFVSRYSLFERHFILNSLLFLNIQSSRS